MLEMATKQQIEQINQKLEQLEKDVCGINSLSLSDYLARLANECTDIQTNDPLMKKELNQVKKRIRHYQTLERQAHKKATTLAKQHEKVRQRKLAYFQSTYFLTSESAPFTKSKKSNWFDASMTAQRITWLRIKIRLRELAETYGTSPSNNILSMLLTENDQDFLDFINSGKLSLGEEIGHLVTQRLLDIAHQHQHPQKHLARKYLKRFYSRNYPENLLNIASEALVNEITKLILHSQLHPESKRIWLGTARAVEAMMVHSQTHVCYFNPLASQWSWELNRAWLIAAAWLGFEFELVEQHFPNIEAGIISGLSDNLLEQLFYEMRPDTTSQYCGGDAPTATTQEILVLMDLGCKPKKSMDDNRIRIAPPDANHGSQSVTQNHTQYSLRRTHSAPNLFRAPAPPPLEVRKSHFEAPNPTSIFSMGAQ